MAIDRQRAATAPIRRRTPRVLLAMLIFVLATPLVASSGHAAPGDDGEPTPMELKGRWQDRYRNLRILEARLEKTVELATKEYADANRRNYRRSGARHFHRTNANEAKARLAEVREQIAAIYDDARAAGVPLGWLYEVEDEKIDASDVEGLGVYVDNGRFGGEGAYAGSGEDRDGDGVYDGSEPGSGRNPLYSDEFDWPARPGDIPETGTYDYEAWREDRKDYERSHAPERHLVPGED